MGSTEERSEVSQRPHAEPIHHPQDLSTIKACPFCGGPARVGQIIAQKTPTSQAVVAGFVVGCTRCAAVGPAKQTQTDAVRAWNIRVSDGGIVTV